ncbi:MAG: molecular chaperone DnaJ [Ferroplasma sp.]
MPTDYYQVLGVDKNASQDEIKAKFRELAKKYHPDVNAGDKKAEEKFKEVAEAYEVLSDPAKRKQYDATGSTNFGESSGGGQGGFSWEDFSHFDDINDIFSKIFGGGSFGGGNGGFAGGSETQQDLDIYVKVNISMSDAYYGTSKAIKYRRNAICDSCKGTGAVGGILVTCPTCHGTGRERISRGQGFFNFVQVIVCRTCDGRGKIPKTPCPVCNGKGYIPKMENITINIPKGVDTNTRLRTGKMGNSFGGVTGDLYSVVYVQPNPAIKRTGDNLYVRQAIDFPTAALGGSVEIQLFNEKFNLNVPPGSQPEDVLRIKNAGMPHINSKGNGDLLVVIKLEVPRHLTAKERELIEELKGEPVKKSWFHI